MKRDITFGYTVYVLICYKFAIEFIKTKLYRLEQNRHFYSNLEQIGAHLYSNLEQIGTHVIPETEQDLNSAVGLNLYLSFG